MDVSNAKRVDIQYFKTCSLNNSPFLKLKHPNTSTRNLNDDNQFSDINLGKKAGENEKKACLTAKNSAFAQ